MPVTLGLRPRLQLDVKGSAASITDAIRASRADYPVTALESYIVITIPESRRHYWSPQLQVELEDMDGGMVHISGLITPMPAVWTLFAGIYTTILVMGFFGLMFGLAQLQIGAEPAWGLWSLPGTAILIGAVYAAAKTGQKIGRQQTDELTAFLHASIDNRVPRAGESVAAS